jgi:hypothetical protein
MYIPVSNPTHRSMSSSIDIVNPFSTTEVMTSASSTSDQLGYRFLDLPRELRDLIYPYMVTQDDPIDITHTNLKSPVEHPVIAAEWLEAIYAHNICSVTFSIETVLKNRSVQRSIWGAHPEYKRCIRWLTINVDEAFSYEHQYILGKLEPKCIIKDSQCRQEWKDLFELPRLESLAINMQKQYPRMFSWAIFSPILYQLREHMPRLQITFNISFDAILDHVWDEMFYIDNAHDDSYLPMGFVDLSDLIALPTDEDKRYVDEHMRGSRDVGARDIVRGLLDESPENRRLLAQHYVVKEPQLLRVLMAEHYEVYKRNRDARTIEKWTME